MFEGWNITCIFDLIKEGDSGFWQAYLHRSIIDLRYVKSSVHANGTHSLLPPPPPAPTIPSLFSTPILYLILPEQHKDKSSAVAQSVLVTQSDRLQLFSHVIIDGITIILMS